MGIKSINKGEFMDRNNEAAIEAFKQNFEHDYLPWSERVVESSEVRGIINEARQAVYLFDNVNRSFKPVDKTVEAVIDLGDEEEAIIQAHVSNEDKDFDVSITLSDNFSVLLCSKSELADEYDWQVGWAGKLSMHEASEPPRFRYGVEELVSNDKLRRKISEYLEKISIAMQK